MMKKEVREKEGGVKVGKLRRGRMSVPGRGGSLTK